MNDLVGHRQKALAKVVGEYFSALQGPYSRLLGWEQDVSNGWLFAEAETTFAATMSINNVGDPWATISSEPIHTKPFERAVVQFFARAYHDDPDAIWGCTTPGGSYSNLQALLVARDRLQDNVLGFYSEAAHHSVPKAFHTLGMRTCMLGVDDGGVMRLDQMAAVLRQQPEARPIVVATAGTTLQGGIDDMVGLRTLLEAHGQPFHLHCDAAFFGGYLFLLEDPVPGMNFACFDSLAISGHKFFGLPIPISVFCLRKEAQIVLGDRLCITEGACDVTLSGSRDGHTPLLWWYLLRRKGRDGLRCALDQAMASRDSLCAALQERGYEVLPHDPRSLLVPVAGLPWDLMRRWGLPEARLRGREVTRLTVMPHVDAAMVQRFLDELDATAVARASCC